jgi:hypothetical protein
LGLENFSPNSTVVTTYNVLRPALGKDGRQRDCGDVGGNAFSVCFSIKLMYCTVQYIMGRSDDNSAAPQFRVVQRNRSHEMLLVRGIQAANFIKYFYAKYFYACIQDPRDGEMNA